MKKLDQKGSHLIVIVVGIVVLALAATAGYKVVTSNRNKSKSNTPIASQNNKVKWSFTGTDWRYMGGDTPPTCANPLAFANSPANVSLATSILYPGQTRGGNYKPHGGFRFDGVANDKINVRAPMDAQIFEGARYLVNGETQYTFDFIAPCGIMYRIGHIKTPAPDFLKIAESFPAAKENDSRTTMVGDQKTIKANTLIATAVGVTQGGINTFFDFGVYDLRIKNAASQTAAYQQAHATDKELSWHATCWFNYLPNADAARVKGLPAGDPTSGKTSDYCTASGDNTSVSATQPSTTTNSTNVTEPSAGTGSGAGTGGGGGNGTGGGRHR